MKIPPFLSGPDAIKLMLEWDESKEPPPIKTGLSSLDALTGGFGAGELILLGARTSTGKSALALNIAEIVAREKRILYASFEMNIKLIFKRLFGLDKRKMREAQDNFNIDFILEGREITKFLELVERLHKNDPYDMVVIDHLHLLRTKKLDQHKHDRFSGITEAIQEFGLKKELTFLLLAQLGRGSEREGRIPVRSDLRESGTIEECADKILLLHRPNNSKDATLFLAKNRSGECGKVDLLFDFKRVRFFERDPNKTPLQWGKQKSSGRGVKSKDPDNPDPIANPEELYKETDQPLLF